VGSRATSGGRAWSRRAATALVVAKALHVISDCLGAIFLIFGLFNVCLFYFKFCGFVTCKLGCIKNKIRKMRFVCVGT